MRTRSWLDGWILTAWAAAGLALIASAAILMRGAGEEGIRTIVRGNAQLAVVLFSAAFAASALARRWPNRATRWLRRNRRYVGVSFAVAHSGHLAALVALASVSRAFRDEVDAVTIVGGGLAYVFLAAMTATSFDRSAAWIGPRRWKILHTTGVYYIWIIFFQSYLQRALLYPIYVPLAALLVAGLGARALAWSAGRARSAAAEAGA